MANAASLIMTSSLLKDIAYNYPAIDNHAHPICTAEHRSAFPLEGIISEAQGSALTDDSIHTLASYRAMRQLATLYGIDEDSTWEELKAARDTIPYDQLCALAFQPTRIQCLLLDDGLGGVNEFCHNAAWHNNYTPSPTKRIVRVEVVAQDILKALFKSILTNPLAEKDSLELFSELFRKFQSEFYSSLTASALDPCVVGFKSVACYRTGLDILIFSPIPQVVEGLGNIFKAYQSSGQDEIRIADKGFNDFVVRSTLAIAGTYKKPVQFHTGLGDSDISLIKSSPAHMQPIIKAYPNTTFVILHSSYPYTRDAGYLTAVYKNVYLDFGEIFPMLSAEGQRGVIRQILELCPTNKIMWSTDGHWWPESFYLGTIQARQILYEVLLENVQRGDLNEVQACSIVKRALFDTANSVYSLGLNPAVGIP